MKRRARAWWPVVAWMGAIVFFTTVPVPHVPIATRAPHLDKLAHFLLYLGLGWSLGRALWISGRATPGWVTAAVLSGLAFAVLDEWHQELLPARHASVADWLADAAGVLAGVAAYLWPRARGLGRDVGEAGSSSARGAGPGEVGARQ